MTLLTHLRENLAHVVDEAHVEHAVSFVEHDGTEAGESECAALHQVLQASWGADNECWLMLELRDLWTDVGSSDRDHAAEAETFRKSCEFLLDLHREFASWCHDKYALPFLLHHFVDERNEESCGLASTGFCEADDILSEQCMRNSLVLNRSREFVAASDDVLLEVRIDIEISELVFRNEHWLFGRDDRLVSKASDLVLGLAEGTETASASRTT